MKRLLITLLFLTGSAHAQTLIPKLNDESRRGEVARLARNNAIEKFDAADENKDGKLSKDEVLKHFPYLAENFEQRDKDKDGFLSWEEFLGHDRWKK